MNFCSQIFYISIFINILIYSSCIIILPFEIINPNYESISEDIDLMSYLQNLSLYSNLSIGNPPQEIKSFIKFDKSGFNIPYNKYINKNTKSCNELKENKIINDGIEYNGTFCSDDITFINIDSNNLSYIFKNQDYDKYLNDEKYKKTFNNISFINRLSDEIGYKNYGYIGLQFPDKDKFDIINFVPLLKNKNIIKNDTWSLLFETKTKTIKEKNFITIDEYRKIKGQLILGDELQNFYPDKFMNNMSYSVNMFNRDGLLNWDIDFRNIYINDSKLYISVDSEIRPDSALYFGSLAFKLNIDIKFFNEYFKDSICQVKNMTLFPEIMYYMCDSSIKGENNLFFNIKTFPNITFEHKGLGELFVLTYKDVFIQDINNKNIFYFLFVFDRNRIFNINEDRFILGMKFCEKFQFEFSNDKKLITHYVKIEEELDKESKSNDNIINDEKNNKNNIILFIILIVIFGAILFVFGMLFQKKIIKIPRKARANELDEDFEYKAKNEEKNEGEGLGIS